MSSLVPEENTVAATPPITGDELLEFTALQKQLLDSASNSASETIGKPITFENPLALFRWNARSIILNDQLRTSLIAFSSQLNADSNVTS